ncbi:MAG: toll/interleukin-1 receptor domain-containing protein [Phototrophicaceae bacterium]
MAVSEFSDVFVSYRRKDVEFVKQLVEALRQAGKEVWIDWEDIPPGSVEFTSDIKNGLQGADAFIAVLSPSYLESTYCVDMELGAAVELNKKLIPIVYQPFDTTQTPKGVSHINWIYFTPHAGQANTFEESFPKVLNALEADLQHAQTHSRIQLRALDWEKHARGSGYLLRADELSKAENWLMTNSNLTPKPTPLHYEYIQTSRKSAVARSRSMLVFVSLGMIVSLILAVLSGVSFYQARANALIAEEAETVARRRAEEADARAVGNRLEQTRDTEPFLAYGLGLALMEMDNLPIDIYGDIYSMLISSVAKKQLVHTTRFTSLTTGTFDDFVLGGTLNGEVLRWDVATGEETRLARLDGTIVAVANHPREAQFMAASENGDLKLYDINTTDLIRSYTLPEADHAHTIRFIKGGDEVLIGSHNRGHVYRIDLATGDILATYAPVNLGTTVLDIDVKANETAFLMSDSMGNAYEWSLVGEPTPEPSFHVSYVDAPIGAVAYLPDGQTIMLARQWDLLRIQLDTGQVLSNYDKHLDNISEIMVMPDQAHILTASYDHTMLMTNIETGTVIKQFRGHSGKILGITIDQAGQHMVSFSDNHYLIYWDLTNLPYRVIGEGNAVAIDPTGKTLAVSDLLNLYTYSLETEQVLEYFGTPDRHYDSILFTADGSQIIAAGFGEGFEVWDAQTGELRFTASVPVIPQNSHEHRMMLSPDGKYLGISGRNAGVYMWDTATWEQVAFLPPTQFDSIFALSPIPGQLVIQDKQGKLLLYDWQAQKTIFSDEVTGGFRRMWSAQFNSDGSKLAVAYTSGRIMIVSLDENQIPTEILAIDGHLAEVSQMLFIYEDKQLLSSSWDQTLALWDVETGESLRTYERHLDQVYSLSVSPDNRVAYSASYDNSIYAWDVWMTEGALRQWVEANRDVIVPTCEQLINYKLAQLCK